jgi:hypothetical protein
VQPRQDRNLGPDQVRRPQALRRDDPLPHGSGNVHYADVCTDHHPNTLVETTFEIVEPPDADLTKKG